MPRIRSIHPGQWTDEAFVECSPLARLLALGIRNEADDQGVFEWKPLTLRMRLFPADDVDVPALLDELISSGQVEPYEVDGKKFGLIRNFTKWQKPLSPQIVHPLPPGSGLLPPPGWSRLCLRAVLQRRWDDFRRDRAVPPCGRGLARFRASSDSPSSVRQRPSPHRRRG